jgi:signal transduction histidine kinase
MEPQGLPSRSPAPLIAGALAGCTVVTALVIAVPALQFAYRSPLAHVAIESAASVIAGLGAAIAFLRARRSQDLGDVLLFAALAALATTNLCFSVLPALAGDLNGRFGTWAPAAGRFIGATGLVAAAFAGGRMLRKPERAMHAALGGVLLTLIGIAVAVAVLGGVLPRGVDVLAPAEESGRPSLSGSAAIMSLQVIAVVLFAAAAFGFARQGRAATWLAVAMVLGAAARVNYVLYPSLYSEYVYVGDIFRLGFYIVLLGVVVQQILVYERQLAHLAVAHERRRLARDLHDGLAQELAYLSTRAHELGGHEVAHQAERILLESREAIAGLMRPPREPLQEALRHAAAAAARGQAHVEVSAVHEPQLTPIAREALLRIVAEAARNAVRHGHAGNVRIAIDDGAGVRLRVADDGDGFDPGTGAPGHYGLIGMRERAESLGGTLHVVSAPGRGSSIEVELP